MTTRKIKILLNKYKKGTCSPKEKVWVEQWFEFRRKQDAGLNWEDKDWENFRVELLTRLPFKNNLPKTESNETDYEFVAKNVIETDQDDSNKFDNRFPIQKAKNQPYLIYQIAASFLLLVGISVLFFNLREPLYSIIHPIVWKEFKSTKGRVNLITLSDSTRIWVNSGSTILYPSRYNPKYRQIIIKEGEAYFEVKHDTTRPFFVSTAYLITRDIGTSFNIKAYSKSKSTEVDVISGKVYVTGNDTNHHYQNLDNIDQRKSAFKEYLFISQRLIYNKSKGSMVKDRIQTSDYISWKEGEIRFSKESFADIAIALENRFNIIISFKRGEKKDDILTVHESDKENIEKILKDICLIDKTHFQKLGKDHYQIL